MPLNSTVSKLVSYKSWANKVTFTSLSHIPEKELYKEYLTKFKSIANTLNHAYVVDDIFKCHLENIPHSYTSRNTDVCPSFGDLWNKQQLIDEWYVNYSKALSGNSCGKTISFEFIDGGQGEMTISEILLHVVNHGTYHRGFVSMMMSQIPENMPANDLTVYLRDAHAYL